MNDLFPRFFADTAHVCGHEKTLHANFMHQLLDDGVPRGCVEREHRAGTKRIDLVVRAEQHGGRWLASDAVTIAFEFKGGAYNVRNALRGTIDADGYCADMPRLAALRARGIEAWFVCVDMVQLGLALSQRQRLRVAAQCARHGVHFAYYAQGDDRCLIARAGSAPVEVAVARSSFASAGGGRWQDGLAELRAVLDRTGVTEDTVTGLLYHALKRAGVGSGRLSLETYFNCASAGSRMQQRPDLCVFGNRVGGRFNLYRNGDRGLPNDGIKIADLQALIEVKSRAGVCNMTAAAFTDKVLADIDKLVWWRGRLRQTGAASVGAVPPAYVMIAVDADERSLAPAAVDALRRRAEQNAIQFHYVKVASIEKA